MGKQQYCEVKMQNYTATVSNYDIYKNISRELCKNKTQFS